MSEIPLPSRIRELLVLGKPGNRSLLFDKGMNGYDQSWQIGAKAKETFLQDFRAAFPLGGGESYTAFLERRIYALEKLGASHRKLVTQTRLVIGLGLPSPLETGFLFDRCTGCPYLPGSSIKGLLRASARLVVKGELEGDKDFWSAHLDRIFGPEITPDEIPQTGQATFYDAFPTEWPALELEVLTPHYGTYYRDGVAPGDWDNPVPVPFLAIAAGTPFRFCLLAGKEDSGHLLNLLATGLDWLGIGAKTSVGYGVFGPESVAVTESQPARESAPPKSQEPPAPPSTLKGTSLWRGVELQLWQGSTYIVRGGKREPFNDRDLPDEVYSALKRNRKLEADVLILKVGSAYRIMEVRTWREA